MPWATAERKVIGTVVISETAPPSPPAPPPPIIQSFLDEHKKLKKIIDQYGVKGACVPRGVLERESRITGDRLGQHIKVFEDSDFASPITEEGEEVLCGKSALRELKKKLEVEL